MTNFKSALGHSVKDCISLIFFSVEDFVLGARERS